MPAVGLEGYLARKKQPPPLGPPQGPGRSPTVGSQVAAVFNERGTPVSLCADLAPAHERCGLLIPSDPCSVQFGSFVSSQLGIWALHPGCFYRLGTRQVRKQKNSYGSFIRKMLGVWALHSE